MKFQPVTKSIEMFGHQEVSNMTIEASGKMFRTIISGLYSRKIESICRESIANAKDGHIKRGNPERPAYVHAPTSWEPFYSVRDYGCSMDHETVMRRFTAIGWSSKEDSNEEIGTFGLGSKAPFAYTSMFSVTTWLAGVQRTYDAYLNEEGKPMMALAAECPSDEEQGLMLRFDVRSPDFYAFQKAIRFVALAHSPCFESNLDNVRSAVIREGDDFDSFYFSHDVSDGPRVQIGCVTYPIDFSALDSTSKGMGVLKNSSHLVVRTKIGDLGVVPSREGLEYTEKTIANLTSYLTNLFAGFETEVTTRCAALTNVWEAASYWEEIKGHHIKSAIGRWTRILGRHMTLDQTDSFHVDLGDRPYIKKLVCNSANSLSVREVSVYARRSDMVVYVQDECSEPVKFWRKRVAIDLDARVVPEAMFVCLPNPAAAVARLRKQLELTKADRKERKHKLDGLFSKLAGARADLKEAIARYGCPTVINLADLPEPPRVQRNPKDHPVATYTMNGGMTFEREDIYNLNEDKFQLVFPLKRGAFENRHHDIGPKQIRKAAKDKGFDIGSLIGVSVSNVKRYLAENPSCILWSEVFNADAFNIDELKARADTLAGESIISLDEHEDIYNGIGMVEGLIDLPPVLREFNDAYRAITEIRDAAETARREFALLGPPKLTCVGLIRVITGDLYAPNGVTEENRTLDALAEKVKAAFPHLEGVCSNYEFSNTSLEPVVYVLGVLARDALAAKHAPVITAPTETIIAPANVALAA